MRVNQCVRLTSTVSRNNVSFNDVNRAVRVSQQVEAGGGANHTVVSGSNVEQLSSGVKTPGGRAKTRSFFDVEQRVDSFESD